MAIKLYNSLTKTKEEFVPLVPNSVSMYHCGPTVYDKLHIGNLRSFFLGDLLRRMFEVAGYKVNQVMNITDIGHLVSDADSGEDKMTKGILREGLPVNMESLKKIGDIYSNYFLKDLETLNIKRPHTTPKASEHINEDIELIKKLEEKGVLYMITDGLYFDTSKFPNYGELAGVKFAIAKSKSDTSTDQSRIGDNPEKRNPQDFAVWKLNNTMGYESPWGAGFPGWHIECSAMAAKYLGETLDIHTGGADLEPIHHNNEIAQSECATGTKFARYWMHGAFLNLKGGKMSKSAGGFITLDGIVEAGFSPLAYRYFLLGSHYRTQTDYSIEILQQAQDGLNNLVDAISRFDIVALESVANNTSENYEGKTLAYVDEFNSYIQDDLNTSKGLALLWIVVKDPKFPDGDKAKFIAAADKTFGLNLIASALSKAKKQSESRSNIPEDIKALAQKREEARKNKDWDASDVARKEIEEKGYTIKDSPSGYIIEKK